MVESSRRVSSRRVFLVGALGLFGTGLVPRRAAAQSGVGDEAYAAVGGEPFPVPAINLSRIDPRYLRAAVAYDTAEPAGTIVIDPARRYLYLTDGAGGAIRYGVGVGRQGFAWSGTAKIHDKQAWPDWYPPKEMLARDPHIMASMATLRGGIGMPGGPGNPLGARAMYLWQGNRDTLYRIHGTVEPWTIGSSISSGCIRMINQDVMDLYERVPIGTKVVVLGGERGEPEEARRRRRRRPDDDADPTGPGPADDAATQPLPEAAQAPDQLPPDPDE